MGSYPARTLGPVVSLAARELNPACRTQRPEPMLVRLCVFAEVGIFFCSNYQQRWAQLFVHLLPWSGLALELDASESLGVVGGHGRKDSKAGAEAVTRNLLTFCFVKVCSHNTCSHALDVHSHACKPQVGMSSSIIVILFTLAPL